MGFCLLLKTWENIRNRISKILCGKYSPGMLAARQKFLDHAKAFNTTLKKVIQKTAKPAGDLIGNKIAHKITNFSKTAPQNTSEIVRSKTGNIRFDDKIPRKKTENY